MRNDNVYTVQFRRRKQGMTNYKRRLKVLVSGKPRMVVRRSSNNIQAAIVEYSPKGDIVRVVAHSSQLKKFGWQYRTSNLPSAYLVGFLLGKKAKGMQSGEIILDIGLNKSVRGSRIYALLAGALHAGLSIPCNKEVLPSEDRFTGRHIALYATKLKDNPSEYKRQFSLYLKENKDTEGIVRNFEETKKNIEANFKA